MTDWQALEKKYFLSTFKRQPVTLVRGEGSRVWDDQGQEYLDFVGGWAVTALGHCHPVIVEAVSQQVRTLIQVSNSYYTVPQVELAQLLVENSCLDRVFFCNSGAEANEGAVKLARRYGKSKLGGAYEVISAKDSFHGRTLAMTAATGQKKFQDPYVPLPSGFVNVDFNSVEAVIQATGPQTCAVMLEPVQGESGVHIPSGDYLQRVRAWCDQKGLLLILDEVQTGVGRLGTLFGYQHFRVEPDIIALAKGLGGGLPIGAFLAKEKAAAFVPGDHGSTFGGNPLACAAALAVMRYVLEKDLPAHVARVGAYLEKRLADLRGRFAFITDIRGLGLLWALEFSSDRADAAVAACLREGLLVNPVKPNALRFMPPLTTTEADVDEATAKLGRALTGLR